MEKYIRDSLPNATFIGFTGTPVKTKDKMTTAIFGDIVDTYDMTQSIEDGSTVKLYYESRLAKVWLDDNKLREIDHYYDDLVSSESATEEQVLESQKKLTNMELIVGDDDRLKLLANDIYKHYMGRKNFLNGKAMIVCMSRKIAYKVYNLLISIDPSLKDIIALVVTDSNKDSAEMREVFGTKRDRDELARNFKGEEIKEETRDNDNITASDLFSNLDDSETYTTYYVYIVKEEDTIDKILIKYGITKEAFEDYNDITNIKPGDKVIIPKTSE